MLDLDAVGTLADLAASDSGRNLLYILPVFLSGVHLEIKEGNPPDPGVLRGILPEIASLSLEEVEAAYLL